MHPDLYARYAHERLEDDHGGLQPQEDGVAAPVPESITIRPLRPHDVKAVVLLAELEERPVPPGPLLLAEIEGRIEAAVGLEGGETVANPFASSASAVTLLRLRAEQLRAA